MNHKIGDWLTEGRENLMENENKFGFLNVCSGLKFEIEGWRKFLKYEGEKKILKSKNFFYRRK